MLVLCDRSNVVSWCCVIVQKPCAVSGAGQEDDGVVPAVQGAAVQAVPLRFRTARPQVCSGHGRGTQAWIGRAG